MSEVDRLKAEWESLRAEELRLAADAERLTMQLRTITDRLRELRGHWNDIGAVKYACNKWQQAVSRERDKSLPRVIWAREPKYGEKELVLVKATPKRLFVRRIGDACYQQYDRSTGMRVGRPNSGFSGIIDVAKTLGTTNG